MNEAAAVETPRAEWSDRLNPILIKEVRQALRGRYFKFLFWLTLVCATVIGLVVVGDAASNDQLDTVGRTFCVWILGVLAVAVHAFVPFSAFMATSAEWDENTWDLLVISDLKPRQLVVGKLLAAVVQALLFYSAFAPFLVFAFLLTGVDLLSLVVILASSVLTCAMLSLVGIALSSLARARFARIALMAVFGAALLGTTGGSVGLAFAMLNEPNALRTSQALVVVSAYATLALVVGGLAFATAIARLAHEEENRSSGARALVASIVVAAAAWSAWAVRDVGEADPAWVCQFAAAVFAFVPLLVFTTEEETLRRGVAKRVPKSPVLALLCVPFLPGGGRGVLLLALLATLALATVPLVLARLPSATDADVALALTSVAVTYGYLVLHIAVIAGFASFFVRSRGARLAVRWTIVVSVPVALFLPALIGLFLGSDAWTELEHPFNPITVLSNLSDDSSINAQVAITLLSVAVIAAASLNAPRVVAGVREVLAASRARRAS